MHELLSIPPMKVSSKFPPNFSGDDLNPGRSERTFPRNYSEEAGLNMQVLPSDNTLGKHYTAPNGPCLCWLLGKCSRLFHVVGRGPPQQYEGTGPKPLATLATDQENTAIFKLDMCDTEG